MKPKVLVTISGGRSSGYKGIKLFQEYQDKYDMTFVYANTGEEHEKTLEFVHNIETHFGVPIIWIEADVQGKGVGTRYKTVTFETASRKGEPFEDVIKKYGLPTHGYMHCTRELKVEPMNYFMKIHNITHRTLGIRKDEPNRYNPKKTVLYPLWEWGETKQSVNRWWGKQLFDLEIPDYLGNCKWCYKKSDRKLNILAKEHPEVFDFPAMIEKKYPDENRKIFRGYRTTQDVLNNKVYDLFDDICADECGTVIDF